MKCIICKNDSFSGYLAEKSEYPNYIRCKKCGLVFAYPQKDRSPVNDYYYPKNEKEVEARLKNYECRYKLIDNYINNPDPHFLDIGTADGIFLYLLKLRETQATGIETNELAVEYADSEYGIKIINRKFENWSIGKKFDVVTMFNVLEHVRNPLVVMKKIDDITKPGSLLVLELPYIHHLFSKLSLGNWHHFQKTHNWFFNKDNLQLFLKHSGFQVKHISFIPKVVTYAKIFNLTMSTLKAYRNVSREKYLEFRKSKFFKTLKKKYVKLNFRDYLFAIAEKV